MQHDFSHTSGRPSRKDSSGNNCKGIAAFMVCHQEVHCMKSQSCNFIDVFFYSQDYVFPPYTTSNPMPNKWSGCSVDDFRAHYQLFKNRDGRYCLEGNAPQRKSSTGSVFRIDLPPFVRETFTVLRITRTKKTSESVPLQHPNRQLARFAQMSR